MKKLNIKRLFIKGVLPFTTALTMSSFSAMTAQAASSRVVEDSFIEEESNVSEELESISVDLDSLSELEITESAARNYYANIVFGTDQDVDHSKLNDALATFQPKNQKIEEIAPQVLKYIVSTGGQTVNHAAYSIIPSLGNPKFLNIAGIYDDNACYYTNYFDGNTDNENIKSSAWFGYYPADDEMDGYCLCCHDQGGFYRVWYYPGLEKCFIWNNIGDLNIQYEKDVSSENMEDVIRMLDSLCILASTEYFEKNSYLSTPGEEISFSKIYQLTRLNNYVSESTNSKEGK